MTYSFNGKKYIVDYEFSYLKGINLIWLTNSDTNEEVPWSDIPKTHQLMIEVMVDAAVWENNAKAN